MVRRGNQYLGVQVAAFIYYLKNRRKFDLVIDQFHGIPFFTPLYVKKTKMAITQETAKEVWFLNHFKFPFNLIIGFLGYFAEPFIFKMYKNIIFMTASESAKKDLISYGISKEKIFVVYHGVKSVSFRKQKKEKNPTIVYLGRLSKDKGVEDALRTFQILIKKNKRYTFWIIGKGETKDYEKKIKKMAYKIIPSKNIHFFGQVSEREKFELLSKAHILINPSRKEGWGLVNIEANLAGVPVAAYSSPGLVDSVKNGISGVIAGTSPQSLAEEIDRLVKDKRLYDKLSRGAVKWSKKFNWNQSAAKSLAVLNRVIKQ